ncbi:MAG TPA: adenylosuccinate lyase [Bacteroidia bacterium]|nr:adenylosuccinate lyase [Bacteroidia bacterium]
MNLTSLDAISPIDGRYRDKCSELANYFSEGALIRFRVMVEIEYFIALCKLPLPQLEKFNKKNFKEAKKIYLDFDEDDARQVKEIERTTNHDVKAVEYFIKIKMNEINLDDYKEFVHFGLTSQDINNTAVPISIKEFLNKIYFPRLNELLNKLKQLIIEWQGIPMLAHTHGQPASPTNLGKEMAVFFDRLQQQLKQLKSVPHSAKFGGATGNFNAHVIAYPKIDWNKFADKFINDLGLTRSQVTTQIEPYDNLASLLDAIKRINTILIDLSRDMWTYISMNYFTQEIRKGEIGSSAMPHKVNPIDFENAEGNFGMANAICEHLSAKLPISRLQRDLTDSTVLRNIGVPFAHSIIAMKSLLKGLEKIKVNTAAINSDLENNRAVVAEAIQTILRREGYPNPYEELKKLTRKNAKVSGKDLVSFIKKLKVNNAVKKELLAITPFNYTGVFKFEV